MVDVPVTISIPPDFIWKRPACFMAYWGFRCSISLIPMVAGLRIGTEQVGIERKLASLFCLIAHRCFSLQYRVLRKSENIFSVPEFGTSLDGVGVGGPGAPEIKVDWVLRIYTR